MVYDEYVSTYTGPITVLNVLFLLFIPPTIRILYNVPALRTRHTDRISRHNMYVHYSKQKQSTF